MSTTTLTTITPSDLQTAQGVYSKSSEWLSAYESKHAALIKLATTAKLPAEIDTKMNQFQVSARAALKAMNDNRTPFTEKAHAFVKAFTDMENRIKALDGEIQALRNASAAAYAKEEAAKREAERLDLARKTERITLLANAEQQVRDAYSAIVQGDKDELLSAFEAITLETLDQYEALLRDIHPVLKYERWEAIKVSLKPTQLNPQGEIDAIGVEALLGGKFDKCALHYKEEIANYAAHLLTLLPHRRAGLERGEAESKEAAELRAKQSQLEADQAAAAKAAAEKKAEAERAEALLNQQVEQANRSAEAPRSIESYSITVTNRQGWVEIFKFYLANTTASEGEDLGKVKLDSMRLLAERLAKSTGVKIDSPHVVYEAKYKVAVKSATKGRKAA